MRIGSGFDAHRFEDSLVVDSLVVVDSSGIESSQNEDIFIKLGGVSIPSKKRVVAHSDGDVILHALCDAILGALALGDIGRHFPDTDPAFKDADSRVLLRSCFEMIKQRNMVVVNADITLIAETPKVAKYVDAMSIAIAEDLEAETARVNVKATTTEKMGYVGREEGIAAQAVILLESL